MNKMLRVLAAALLGWAGLAHAAETRVLFESDPGDYIGQGQTQNFVQPGSTFRASGSSSHLQLNFTSPSSAFWTIDVSAPNGLKPGRYAGASRYPFNGARSPGLSVSGDGRGCNTSEGWFEVKEYVVDSEGTPVRAAIDFRQACEGGAAALYGSLRLNSSIPTATPVLRAVAGPDLEYLQGDTVVLEGGQSFDRNSSVVPTYLWTQTAGTPVTLDDPSNPYPIFTAPVVPDGGDVLKFKLKVSDSTGASDTDSTRVIVHAPSDIVTYVRFAGDAGDYITGGNSYQFTPSNSAISVSTLGSDRNGVEVNISADAPWTLDFVAPQGSVLTPGTYAGAMRYPFQDSNRPGLSVYGNYRGCNTLTGTFEVITADFDSKIKAPKHLDIRFEQHCEGGGSALKGTLKYKASAGPVAPKLDPVAVAGPDITVRRAQVVKLDGSASHATVGALAGYHWMQVSGPSVRLYKADTVSPRFLSPVKLKKATLKFRLTVVDEAGRTGSDTVDVTVGTEQN